MKEVWLIEQPSPSPPLEPARRKRRHWRRVGFAFENKDGSWTLNISELPAGANVLNVREQPQLARAPDACAVPSSASGVAHDGQ